MNSSESFLVQGGAESISKLLRIHDHFVERGLTLINEFVIFAQLLVLAVDIEFGLLVFPLQSRYLLLNLGHGDTVAHHIHVDVVSAVFKLVHLSL